MLLNKIPEITIVKYDKSYKQRWDQFISKAKNSTFLFYRDYMNYHSDRFTDYSLLFFKNNKLIAVFPANIEGNIIISHRGLTFGGVISDFSMRTSYMIEVFNLMLDFFKSKGIVKIIYKAIPYIYHIVPAEEDLYALFINNAKLYRRDLSSTINMKQAINYNKGRKWSVKKSKTFGFTIKKSYDFNQFMSIESELLKNKYNLEPTHTSEEIEMLAKRFPDNIKLFAAYKENRMIAGVIIYESRNVAHTQYIGSNDEGKGCFAQESILDYLIRDYYSHINYFDFGISTEKNGRYLNEGLVQYKEGFGAYSIVYNFFELDIF